MYELKARVAPGLILALPALVDAVYTAPVVSGWPVFATGSACSVALIYGLGLFARARGGAIQPKLWSQWGGPPSTRLLRHRDSHFGDDLKSSIRKAVAKKFSVRLPSPDEEMRNPDGADRSIADVFRQVRPYLRQHDPNGLWSTHSAEYGFYRNLLGCRAAWVTVALAATAFAAVYGTRIGARLLNPASAIGLLALMVSVYVGWAILPGAARHTADVYAESLG